MNRDGKGNGKNIKGLGLGNCKISGNFSSNTCDLSQPTVLKASAWEEATIFQQEYRQQVIYEDSLFKVVAFNEHMNTNPNNLGIHNFVVIHKETGKIIQRIDFQQEPIKEAGVNGIGCIELLAICQFYVEQFQNGQYRSKENAMAITKIQEAKMYLKERMDKRERRGVLNTSKI